MVRSAPDAARRDLRTYTPASLIEKILAGRGALEGERKHVTVLFADVRDSLALAESVDPETWHHVMDGLFQLLIKGVFATEGTVLQYTGDGIMALFGAPLAHEDHAQRACRSALALRDKLRRYAEETRARHGFELGVRIGLNSGEVVVGRIGNDLHMDYTAQGHTVGLAARVEQLAEVGSVFLTEHTARLVEGFFALRPLGAYTLRGVSTPVQVFELVGEGPVQTRLERSARRGFSRFVGRADEMQVLEDALSAAMAGNGSVVGVVGTAGIGKSRLCRELVGRCRERGVAVHETHCIAHGAAPLLPLRELLSGVLGGLHADPAGTRARIEDQVSALVPDAADVALVCELLGVSSAEEPSAATPERGEERQRRTVEILARLLTQTDRARMLSIDDVQWIDPASEAALKELFDRLAGSRTLLVVNHRSEFVAGWARHRLYRELPLPPLGPAATEQLLAELLGDDPSTTELATVLRQRSLGNPFFLEEMVQSLVEQGFLIGEAAGESGPTKPRPPLRLIKPAAEGALPSTIQALLAARIDRLSPLQRQIIQVAAVAGVRFSDPVVRRVVEMADDAVSLADGVSPADVTAALAELVRSELIHAAPMVADEYRFKHPLIQEVAYQSQLIEQRARMHASVARAIEVVYADTLGEQAALLAHHWEAANDRFKAERWRRRAVLRVTRIQVPRKQLRRTDG